MRTIFRSGGLTYSGTTTRQAQRSLRHLYLRSAAIAFLVTLITLTSLLALVLVRGSTATGSPAAGPTASSAARSPVTALGYASASSQSSQAFHEPQATGVAGVPLSPVAPVCGPGWVVVASPNVGVRDNYLTGVTALSSSDMWAVGYYFTGTREQTLAEHWDGTAWIIIYSPNVGTSDNALFGVTPVSTGDVWAVGFYSNGTINQTLAEHWNGSSWSVVNSPNMGTRDNALYGVTAVSSSDVWAVGHYLGNTTTQTLVEHWDGSALSVVNSPNVGTNGNAFLGVTALSSSDVWAVGEYSNGPAEQTLVEHWDGNAWSVVNSPNSGTYNNVLTGVTALSSSDMWAAGYYFTGTFYQTLAEHWDGTAWIIIYSPNVGTSGNYLNGVTTVSVGDVWAVGNYYLSNTTSQTLVEHWDGTQWSVVNSPSLGTGFNTLNAITAVSSSDVWAVGSYENGTFYQTLVERYNLCSPPPTSTPAASGTPASTPIATTISTPTAAPTSCSVDYTDVPVGSTFYPYIHCLACLGIVNGYPDGTFRPNNPVTRGQLSKIVSNSAGYSETHTEVTFQDVPVDSTFYQFIERLATRDIISGYDCGTNDNEPCVPPDNLPYFRPNNNVTRGQTAKIVASAAGLPYPPAGQQSFQDVPEGSTFWQWIEPLAGAGAISGYPCGGENEPCIPPANLPYFRANANVTRGQSTKIVGNTFFPNCQTPARK